MTNWKETVTNPEWKKEIVCPYCKHRYVEISTNDDKTYHLKPTDGWCIITKYIYNIAKGNRRLGKCIRHWKKEGFKVFKFV